MGMASMTRQALSLTTRRRYPAPIETVFRAFTEPEILTRWFSPSADIAIEVLDYDLRPTGSYRFGYRFPDGRLSTVKGRFRKVSRPARLTFTWTWEAPDPHAGIETLVTIELVPREGGTEILVVHELFPDHDSRDRHQDGWRTTLDRLAEILTRE